MDHKSMINLIPIEVNHLEFKIPEGSRFIINRHGEGNGELNIYLPNEFSCLDLKIEFISNEISLKEILDEKFRVNDEIIHSPLNIAPAYHNDYKWIFCQYFFVDGIEKPLLFRVIGLSNESENIIITFSGLYEDFQKYHDSIDEIEASFSIGN